jgi:hypothetical protein
MPSTPLPARHASLNLLLGILLLSAILVPVIALRYAYDTFSRIAGGGGFGEACIASPPKHRIAVSALP